MSKLRYTYYHEEDMVIGWLDDYPDYRTQGFTLDELEENLKSLFEDIASGAVAGLRHHGELTVG